MQNIRRKMQIAQFSQRRSGVPCPGNRADQPQCGEKREPAGQYEAIKKQTGGQQDNQRSTDFRNEAKLGLVHIAPESRASLKSMPTIDMVSNASQTRPDMTVIASPAQASPVRRDRMMAESFGDGRRAGSATKPPNIKTPAVDADAAK
jgi:hypothetical protein